MKASLLFTKTTKQLPKDETSFNAQALIRAGYIDKLFAGVYTLLPLGLRSAKKIENIIRKEINAIDGQEIIMPALHPIENYRKTGRDKIDILYYTKLKNGADLVLGQSHEEVITPLLKKFVFSYKDLPKKVYQFQTKFRNELRAKSGIMRGREFLMKDMYSFHASQQDLDDYYLDVQKAYASIFKKCGLGDLTYLTYASGGTFSKYSHEYQTLTQAGEDLVYICDACKVAVNKEIMEDQQNKCPECGNDKLREEKAVEVGNIFKLGSRFAKAFDFTYTDKDGSAKDVLMGCYGIGIGRLMGTAVEVHHDEKGIIWPKTITPHQVHLLCLSKNSEKADKVYSELINKHHIDVLYDDRQETAGSKLNDADLIGIPVRAVISDRTGDAIEVKLRSGQDSKTISLDEFVKFVQDYYS